MNAKEVLSKQQKITLIIFSFLYLVCAILFLRSTVIATLCLLTFFYTINILISIFTLLNSFFHSEEIKISKEEIAEKEKEIIWPTYTILCPLYKESNILQNFVSNMENLDYPKDKLECLLLLEEDDNETYEKAVELKLPNYFKVIVIPHSLPKTKPKACNIGLKYAKGEYLVIYDAEDLPDPDQLKKTVIFFKQAAGNVGCVQAKLNFYNPNQNFLTRMFTSEYTLWFDLVLPGLQSINAPIPLGGTSNHFKVWILKALGGWDPYNVTEDCDLGLRLKENGFETAVLDSTTWEEANCNLKNWLRQRSRWVKGYFQTFLVHTRHPFKVIRKVGFFNFLMFTITTGFLPFAALINPLLWLTTISYFALRPYVGTTIEQFFPNFILYPSVFCLIIGNFICLYNYLISASKRGFDSYVKYGLLMPICWLLISVASWYALIQLIFKPHFWEKTQHGLNILNKEGASNA